ncbi:MAG: PIN domain-containing protein [Planctomyces sp.]|jgi:ribonuclease VapC
MSDCVLDASAVLAVLLKEPGADIVRPHLPGAMISAVNVAEIINRRLKNGESLERNAQVVGSLQMRIVDFDFEQAVMSASFKPYARIANLSLADRACLSLGLLRNVPVLTAEQNWTKTDMGVNVRLIRSRPS